MRSGVKNKSQKLNKGGKHVYYSSIFFHFCSSLLTYWQSYSQYPVQGGLTVELKRKHFILNLYFLVYSALKSNKPDDGVIPYVKIGGGKPIVGSCFVTAALRKNPKNDLIPNISATPKQIPTNGTLIWFSRLSVMLMATHLLFCFSLEHYNTGCRIYCKCQRGVHVSSSALAWRDV